ncbi:hypothetical protein AALB_2648 [Agarivorans albus MKT 106]|uniref:Uncharacterized protein n=1 Tax=Agarivorans albus MKT 106 TaxID=1331007 RepID=R9PMR4_AGAAL|nr:hypothetical protein AALB_2648 [Agarivorans albus MKT 106]
MTVFRRCLSNLEFDEQRLSQHYRLMDNIHCESRVKAIVCLAAI